MGVGLGQGYIITRYRLDRGPLTVGVMQPPSMAIVETTEYIRAILISVFNDLESHGMSESFHFVQFSYKLC